MMVGLGACLNDYEHDVIQAFVDYPRSSKLFSDVDEWEKVPIFCYDAGYPFLKNGIASFYGQAVPQALYKLEKQNASYQVQRAANLTLDSLARVYEEKAVWKFDAIVLQHAEIPLLVIEKCKGVAFLGMSKERSIVVDYQKVIDVLQIPKKEQTGMTSRQLSLYIEGWIATVMLSVMLFIFILAGVAWLCGALDKETIDLDKLERKKKKKKNKD